MEEVHKAESDSRKLTLLIQ